MSLTYVKPKPESFPVAKIISKNLMKYVYISEDEEASEDILEEPLEEDMLALVCESLANGLSMNQVSNILKKSTSNKGMKSIRLEPGEFILIMPSPTSERMMVGGETGCGKSTIAALYATLWKEMNPGGKVHLFARQEDDPAFENVEHEEIVVDDSILKYKLDLDEFSDSLVIFDDMDNLQDKKVLKYIHDLMGDLMSNGRKKNIWVVYMTHILLNRNQTKVALNESNKVVFFNGCGARQNINFLKTYAALPNEDVKMLTSLDSRWVCLSRKIPRYVIHEKGIFLL